MSNPIPPMCEQIGHDKIRQVVHRFYARLIEHPRLGHFFQSIDDFDSHEQRITDFWWLALGGQLEQPPKIDMIGKHFPLGITAEDLETWLVILGQTLGEELEEKQAHFWMDKALQIGARIKQIVIDHQAMGVPLRQP